MTPPENKTKPETIESLKQELFESQEKIEKLEHMRIEFVANVSHELKTPLTSIQGYVETLLEGDIEDEVTKNRFLGKIKKNSERLEFLISDLLELSDIESQTNLHFSTFPLSRLLTKIEGLLEVKIKRKNQKFISNVPDDFDVKADENRLEQILINLIDNGLKYTPDESIITLNAKRENENTTIITVTDNGLGIAKEHLPRIFERFYRVDKARSRSLGGTGLGLAITKHLVQAHGGTISVDSKESKGTTL